MAADVASVQFSRTVERHERRPAPRLVVAPERRVLAEPADAGLSKLNSMLGLIAAVALERSQVVASSRGPRPSSQVRSTC